MCSKEILPAVKMNPQSVVSNRATLPALLCLICTLVALTVADDKPCSTTGSTCVCQTDKGQTIDLSPLDRAKKDKKAKFTGIKDKAGYSYDYNPCTTFSEGTGDACQDVFVCQTLAAKNITFTIATNEQIMHESSSGKYYAQYNGPAGRVAKVYLNCDHHNCGGTIASVVQPDNTNYVLQLYSCHACPGGCGSGCAVAPGIIGIVLIVVIIVSLVAYFIIGALLMKFHFQASGTDVIPNKSFWFQLPLLIKDGFVFTFSPCVKFIGEKMGRRNDYQKI